MPNQIIAETPTHLQMGEFFVARPEEAKKGNLDEMIIRNADFRSVFDLKFPVVKWTSRNPEQDKYGQYSKTQLADIFDDGTVDADDFRLINTGNIVDTHSLFRKYGYVGTYALRMYSFLQKLLYGNGLRPDQQIDDFTTETGKFATELREAVARCFIRFETANFDAVTLQRIHDSVGDAGTYGAQSTHAAFRLHEKDHRFSSSVLFGTKQCFELVSAIFENHSKYESIYKAVSDIDDPNNEFYKYLEDPQNDMDNADTDPEHPVPSILFIQPLRSNIEKLSVQVNLETQIDFNIASVKEKMTNLMSLTEGVCKNYCAAIDAWQDFAFYLTVDATGPTANFTTNTNSTAEYFKVTGHWPGGTDPNNVNVV